jgi:signal peptidase I
MIYTYQKSKLTFGEKRGKMPTKMYEWVDAIIFAVVAATFYEPSSSSLYHTHIFHGKTLLVGLSFVVKYYAQEFQTPLTFPFVHHTIHIAKRHVVC